VRGFISFIPRKIGRKSKKLLKHPFEHQTYVIAKTLGWSQRRVVNEMGADEITDWMIFNLTESPQFLEKLDNEIPELTPEEESEAIKRLFLGLGNGRRASK
jgi:hypothetical protein